MTFYELSPAGIECYDIFTKSGRFAGLVVQKKDGTHRLYWNSTGTRGSARKFATRAEALEFMHQRREKRAVAQH